MTHAAPTIPANDRLKSRFGEILWISLIAAVGIHFLVLEMWPEMSAEVRRQITREVEVLPIPDVPIPDAPQSLTRPKSPVIVEGAPIDATILPDPDFGMARELPPPPSAPTADASREGSAFFTYEVAPRLTNPDAFGRALERAYPAALREAGIGGTVLLQVFIDEEGRALEGRVVGGSGHTSLDEAAVRLIDVMRFSPAMNRDKRVPVWVQLPISFTTRNDG